MGQGGSWSAICFVSVTVFALVLISCERTEVPYGGNTALVTDGGEPTPPRLASVPAQVHVESVAPRLGGGPDGAALFGRHCAACHQTTGKGIPGVFPPLDGSAYVVSDNVDRLASIIVYGLSGPMYVNGILYNGAMAAFGSQMTDEELAAVATYIRNNWSNSAPPVTPQVFAAVRSKWGSRGPFSISELGEEK